MAEALTYKEKWQDPVFADLFLGFKALILPAEREVVGRCADIIVSRLASTRVRVLEVGPGDGRVALAFLARLRHHVAVASYVAIDISPELVAILRRQEAAFLQYSESWEVKCADATHFVPRQPPDLVVAFNSWYGISFEEISRYFAMLQPGGLLAIVLSSREGITSDLTNTFAEPKHSAEDLITWLHTSHLPYSRFDIVSQRIGRADFVIGCAVQPKAEAFFRYLLRRPHGDFGDVLPYLSERSERYFNNPQVLILLQAPSC